MRKARPILVGLISMCALVLSFQNCSNYSVNPALDEASSTVGGSYSSFQGLKILSQDITMRCFDDHVQIGGSCNVGESVDNYIVITMTDGNRNAVGWYDPSSGSNVYSYVNSKCEAGRFSVILSRPNDPVLSAGAGAYDYNLQLQMYTQAADSSAFEAGERSPQFPMLVEGLLGCPAPL